MTRIWLFLLGAAWGCIHTDAHTWDRPERDECANVCYEMQDAGRECGYSDDHSTAACIDACWRGFAVECDDGLRFYIVAESER